MSEMRILYAHLSSVRTRQSFLYTAWLIGIPSSWIMIIPNIDKSLPSPVNGDNMYNMGYHLR